MSATVIGVLAAGIWTLIMAQEIFPGHWSIWQFLFVTFSSGFICTGVARFCDLLVTK